MVRGGYARKGMMGTQVGCEEGRTSGDGQRRVRREGDDGYTSWV